MLHLRYPRYSPARISSKTFLTLLKTFLENKKVSRFYHNNQYFKEKARSFQAVQPGR